MYDLEKYYFYPHLDCHVDNVYLSDNFDNYPTGQGGLRIYFSGSGFFTYSGYTIPSGSGIK